MKQPEKKFFTMDKVWAKGTMPGWFTAILMAIVTYLLSRYIQEFDQMRSDYNQYRRDTAEVLANHDKRLALAEGQGKQLTEQLSKMELNQKDIVLEIKSLAVELRARR